MSTTKLTPGTSPPSRLPGDRSGEANVVMTVVVVMMGVAAAAGAAFLLVSNTLEIREGTSERVESFADGGTGLQIQEAYGDVEGGEVVRLRLFATLPPAADPMALDGWTIQVLVGNQTIPTTPPYLHTILRDRDNSLQAKPPTMGQGDLAEMLVDLDEVDASVDPKASLTVQQWRGDKMLAKHQLWARDSSGFVTYEVVG